MTACVSSLDMCFIKMKILTIFVTPWEHMFGHLRINAFLMEKYEIILFQYCI